LAEAAAREAAREAARDAAHQRELAEAAAREAAREAARDAARQRELEEAVARDAAHQRELAAIRAELAALRVGKEDSPSAPAYATVGFECLATLTASKRLTDAAAPPEDAPAAERAPIASPDDLARLLACATERDLVVAITPLLRAARGFDEAGVGADPCARLLVNSERTPWLDALHAPLPASQLKRPDLFATWEPFWAGHMDAARGAVGRLAARALQLDGCVREFYEAKLGAAEFTPAEFGQLVDYHSRVRGPVRGMLFNARRFWLFESRRELPVQLIKGDLGAPGSRALLRSFFEAVPEPPLVSLLRHLCRELRAVPSRGGAQSAELEGGGGGGGGGSSGEAISSAFLGAGGSARVFRVAAAGEAGLCALKASTVLSRAELDYEFTTMQRASLAGAPVVPVVAKSLVFLVDAEGAHCGGGFLLRGVGARAVLDSAARCAAAFSSLRALHAAGFAHGDARLPNLVCVGPQLLWIDLRQAAAGAAEAAQRADARTLAASALGVVQGGELPAPVRAALDGLPAGGAAAYAELAGAVWRALIGV
jgi:hypothetical protein